MKIPSPGPLAGHFLRITCLDDISEGSGSLMSVSGTPPVRSWALLGRTWAALRDFLAVSGVLLAAFWLVLGVSWMHLGSRGALAPRFC